MWSAPAAGLAVKMIAPGYSVMLLFIFAIVLVPLFAWALAVMTLPFSRNSSARVGRSAVPWWYRALAGAWAASVVIVPFLMPDNDQHGSVGSPLTVLAGLDAESAVYTDTALAVILLAVAVFLTTTVAATVLLVVDRRRARPHLISAVPPLAR